MKAIQATDARNRFEELLEDATIEPIVMQKDGGIALKALATNQRS